MRVRLGISANHNQGVGILILPPSILRYVNSDDLSR